VFFLASKALWWVALPATWVAALLALAFLAHRYRAHRRRALAAALVVIACATLGALASPTIVNALQRVVVASGQSTMKPELEYDVAVVLGGSPTRLEAGADVVRRGRARYLLYSGAISAADSARLAAQGGTEAAEVAARAPPRQAYKLAVQEARTESTPPLWARTSPPWLRNASVLQAPRPAGSGATGAATAPCPGAT